jgi:hypothetical protein
MIYGQQHIYVPHAGAMMYQGLGSGGGYLPERYIPKLTDVAHCAFNGSPGWLTRRSQHESPEALTILACWLASWLAGWLAGLLAVWLACSLVAIRFGSNKKVSSTTRMSRLEHRHAFANLCGWRTSWNNAFHIVTED